MSGGGIFIINRNKVLKTFSILFAMTALTLALCAPHKSLAQTKSTYNYSLPTGVFPHIKDYSFQTMPKDTRIKSEIQNLGNEIKSTVKNVTAKRNFDCLGSPCNIKAFPLMYTKIYSGFWGGFRTRITNEERNDPYLYGIDFAFQRSDTLQSDVSFGVDVPRLLFLPYQPRFMFNFSYLDTDELRYFGTGSDATFYEQNLDQVENTRYDLDLLSIEMLVAFRVAIVKEQVYSIYTGFHKSSVKTDQFRSQNDSQLYVSRPSGYEGGAGGAWTIGMAIDSRDSEFLATRGTLQEFGISVGGSPVGDFKFRRFFFNDRRYFTYKRSTIAHRLTFDALSGDVPFWEFARVAGMNPVADIASSDILRSYFRGRFHEPYKILESIEWRYNAGRIWLFGLRPEFIGVPIAFNIGRLGDSNAWSTSTGAYFAFTKSFIAQVFTGYSPTGWDLSLNFGVNI